MWISDCVAQEESIHLGVELWSTKRIWHGRKDITGNTYGAHLYMNLNAPFWIAGNYQQGRLGNDDISIDTYRWKVLIGRYFHTAILDLFPAAGFEESGVTYGGQYLEIQTKTRVYGPLLFLSTGSHIGKTAVGWYLNGQWMLYDMKNEVAFREGEYIQAEAGLSFTIGVMKSIIGYRVTHHYRSEMHLKYYGFIFSLRIYPSIMKIE